MHLPHRMAYRQWHWLESMVIHRPQAPSLINSSTSGRSLSLSLFSLCLSAVNDSIKVVYIVYTASFNTFVLRYHVLYTVLLCFNNLKLLVFQIVEKSCKKLWLSSFFFFLFGRRGGINFFTILFITLYNNILVLLVY